MLSRLMAKLCNIRWRDYKVCLFEILLFGLCVDYTFILDNIWWSDHWCLEQVIEFELWYILFNGFTHCRLPLIGRGIWSWHRFCHFQNECFQWRLSERHNKVHRRFRPPFCKRMLAGWKHQHQHQLHSGPTGPSKYQASIWVGWPSQALHLSRDHKQEQHY